MGTVNFGQMPGQMPFECRYQVEFRSSGYYINGKRAKRVTSVLAKFPDTKRGLIQWSKERVAATAARMLRDRVIIHPVTGERVVCFPETEISPLTVSAYENPDDIKEETAETGTAVHAFIDEWLSGGATQEKYREICEAYMLPSEPLDIMEVLQKQATVNDMSDADRNRFYDRMRGFMFDKFVQFWLGAGLTFVASEVAVGSVEHGFAGRLDILAQDAWRRLVLIDFKTSKWVSPSYFSQVAAYKLAFEEMTGIKIHKCVIAQCPREWTETNLGFGIYPVATTEYKQIFLEILRHWKATEFAAADCRIDHMPIIKTKRMPVPESNAYAIP